MLLLAVSGSTSCGHANSEKRATSCDKESYIIKTVATLHVAALSVEKKIRELL